jgi:phosphatidylglycerol:prolipoprotein diacylglycerol transferase
MELAVLSREKLKKSEQVKNKMFGLDFDLVPYLRWGIKPILFYLGNFPVPSYSFFMGLAILAGCLVYWLDARKEKKSGDNTFYLIIAALIGGAIGAKIPIMILYWNQIVSSPQGIQILISGRSILGGLIGGTIGVLFTKSLLGIKQRRGNLFAPAIALAMAIGRIGCFLRGCCYGKPTSLPWGVNFGDGILRHPTQIYESIFMLGLFFYLNWKKKKNPKPGQLFDILIISYLIFRFFIEFLRVEEVIFLGLTFFQIICLLGLVWYSRFFIRNLLKTSKKHPL